MEEPEDVDGVVLSAAAKGLAELPPVTLVRSTSNGEYLSCSIISADLSSELTAGPVCEAPIQDDFESVTDILPVDQELQLSPVMENALARQIQRCA